MKKLTVKISGMDCSACVINIDGALEDTQGVIEARTNYAKSLTDVSFDPQKISSQKIISIIQATGYTASIAD
jgi:copper chaperone CopZ